MFIFWPGCLLGMQPSVDDDKRTRVKVAIDLRVNFAANEDLRAALEDACDGQNAPVLELVLGTATTKPSTLLTPLNRFLD